MDATPGGILAKPSFGVSFNPRCKSPKIQRTTRAKERGDMRDPRHGPQEISSTAVRGCEIVTVKVPGRDASSPAF